MHRLESFPVFDRFNAKNQGEDAQYALTRAASASQMGLAQRREDMLGFCRRGHLHGTKAPLTAR